MSDAINNDDAGKCPVDLQTRSLWGLWNKGGGGGGSGGGETSAKPDAATTAKAAAAPQPASLEEAARHAQTPHPGQRLPLSTHRVESTIPRSENNGSNSGGNNNNNNNNSSNPNLPAHQIRVDHPNNNNKNNSNWVYPSEQQVFNAMKRKGWTDVEEESIPSFLRIHNSVNERSWREVLRWEGGGGNGGDNGETVELRRFEGRPRDLTPKAWLLSSLGLRDRPFDRHDWYVVRKPASPDRNHDNDNGSAAEPTEKRYVLDFYMTGDDGDASFGRGGGGGGMMPRVEIDVRPALDSPEAVFQRGTGVLRDLFPGIAREYDTLFGAAGAARSPSSPSTPPTR